MKYFYTLISRASDSDNHFPTIRIPHQEIEYFKTLAILIYGKCTLLGRNTQEILQKLEDAALP